MTQAHDPLSQLSLYVTIEHSCSYLAQRVARNVLADPERASQALYNRLARVGFRRSGSYLYRPYCPSCSACQSLRIPSELFQPDRSQRRNWIQNQDLTVTSRQPEFDPEHYALYERYLKTRHPGGGMDEPTVDQYLGFLTAPWSETLFYEFRLQRQLLAVAVVDRLADGLSAVYTFYEPEQRSRGLGTYAVLWQIAEAQRLGLEWVYLGYWVEDSPKMAYKTRFQPHQCYNDGQWL